MANNAPNPLWTLVNNDISPRHKKETKSLRGWYVILKRAHYVEIDDPFHSSPMLSGRGHSI